MIYDNLNLKGFITHRTKKFAQDLTFQHAASITKECTTRMLNMDMIADSLVQTNSTSSSQQLLEFLARKAELSVFNELHFIGIDNLNAGWRLGRHLVEKGARRIAFLMRDNWAFSVLDRRDGLRAAAEESGLAFEVTNVEPDDVKGVVALLKSRAAPDAVVCGNDQLAVALLKTFRAVGVKVPEDVMVAGFDDARTAALADPPLTTIHQPSDALARSLFEILMIRIRNPALPAMAMYHDAWLVQRASTARQCEMRRADA